MNEMEEYSWRVKYRQSGCPKYEQRIFKGDNPIVLSVEKNTDYEFEVLCMTDPRVFVKHPTVRNSGDNGQIYVGLKGLACVIGAI